MRVYFDHRQTIDLYGKINKGLVVQDTQFYPSDEQIQAGSGDDCLWVGNTYGLGALRGWDGKDQVLFNNVKYQEQRVISEGPLRAIVEVVDKGWVGFRACSLSMPPSVTPSMPVIAIST